MDKCTCGGALSVGFIPDHAGGAAIWSSMFVEGTPQARSSFWEKLRKGQGIAEWSEESVWAITAHRCTACGRLELYAKDRPDPDTHGRPPL